ncbi:MAG: hypothetical protein AAB336_01895 [Acidobacteriota bacterium]
MEFQSGAVRPIGSIEDGWKIIKDDYWTFFAMTLVAVIILIVASLVLGGINTLITQLIAGLLGFAASNSGDAAKISAAIIPQVISLVIGIFVNIIVITLSGALFCGIYKALSRKSSTGVCDFGDLFNGFQNLMPCLIVAVVMSIVHFIFQLVMIMVGAAVGVTAVAGIITNDGRINPSIFGGIFLVILAFGAVSILFNLIISALTAFVYPLISERDLSGGQALILSVKSGLSNIGGLMLLCILMFLMALGGALACLIGVLFVAPILSAASFAAYQSVFGKVATSGFQTPPPPPNFGNF